MRTIMIELIHTYWRESKTRFWEYLAWPEEKLSDLNSILAVYREVDEVNERWVKDLLVVDENCTDDDLSFEISDNVQEVLELAREIDMKFGTYSPAKLFYYFEDADAGNWCIYLRWDGQRGDEPWSAELVRCDENWNFRWDSPDTVDLLKEKEHTLGTVTGYYYDEEYPFRQAKVLELVREMFPALEFPNNS